MSDSNSLESFLEAYNSDFDRGVYIFPESGTDENRLLLLIDSFINSKEHEDKLKTVIISGKAGTGKTRTLVNIIRHFEKNADYNLFVMAPTGRASDVINQKLAPLDDKKYSDYAKTIHRTIYSHDKFVVVNKGNLKIRHISYIKDFEELSNKKSILIVDEASMVANGISDKRKSHSPLPKGRSL